MAHLIFNKRALARVKQALWRSGRGEAKNPAQIDFLVKMNLPPLLGRRNAIYAQAVRLLKSDMFSIPDMERASILNSCVNLLDEAINNTEAIIITLSHADTTAREKQFLAFMEMLRDLTDSASRLTSIGDNLERDGRAMTKFIVSTFSKSLNRHKSKFSSCELHIVNSAQDLAQKAAPAIERYWEYTVSSFNQNNAQRYQHAFERTTAIYFSTALDKPLPPAGW